MCNIQCALIYHIYVLIHSHCPIQVDPNPVMKQSEWHILYQTEMFYEYSSELILIILKPRI